MKKIIILLGIFVCISTLGFYMYKKDMHFNRSTLTKEVKEETVKTVDSKDITFEKAYYDYKGTINKDYTIMMSIYPLGDEMVGSYIDQTEDREMQLKGKLEGQKITLRAFDENEKNIGIFQGNMISVENIEGTYSDANGKEKVPFRLELIQMIYAQYGKRYRVAGAESDEEVENFAKKIQGYVIHNEKEKIANLVYYPTFVTIDRKNAEIKNKEDFIKNYDKIFHPEFKNMIGDALTKYMFANAEGIMFGEGIMNMWFGYYDEGDKLVLRIKKINN